MNGRKRKRNAALRSRLGQVPVWLVVLIVIGLVAVGIFLLFQANRRASSVQARSQEQISTLEQQARGAEARFRLSALRNDLQAGGDAEDLEARYQDIRTDLEEAYGDTDVWGEVEEDLNALGDQIAEGGEEAVATIDSVLERLSAGLDQNQ